MLIKSADDKSKRLDLLKSLQDSAMLDDRQHRWLRDEFFRLQQGISGERDAAHYIDAHFADSENHAVIHDLRLQVDGEVAQIDHLIVSRALVFYLLETKSFGGDLQINEQGEFSVKYAGRSVYGIESPLEQSRRHEKVLRKLLGTLGIAGRAGADLQFEHVVLIHPRGTIQRPDSKRLDTSNVIKADQFKTWHEKFVNSSSVMEVLGLMVNLRGSNTVREVAQKIARQHRPTDLLALPDFMRPSASAQPTTASQRAQPNRKSHYPSEDLRPPDRNGDGPRKQLICASCGAKITFSEGKFCWNNPKRFGGLQYCRQHQADFA